MSSSEPERGDIHAAIQITGHKRRFLEKKAAAGKIPGAAKLFGSRDWTFHLRRLRNHVDDEVKRQCAANPKSARLLLARRYHLGPR